MSTNYAGDKAAEMAATDRLDQARELLRLADSPNWDESCKADFAAALARLTSLATAEALTRIAVALERVAREIDEDADAIRSSRTTD